MEVLGSVIFIPCLFIAAIGVIQYRESQSNRMLILAVASGFICGFGLVMYVWGRVGAWWHHG